MPAAFVSSINKIFSYLNPMKHTKISVLFEYDVNIILSNDLIVLIKILK